MVSSHDTSEYQIRTQSSRRAFSCSWGLWPTCWFGYRLWASALFSTNNTAADLKNMKAMSSSFIRHTTIFLAILLGQVNQEFNQQLHFSGAPTHLAIPPLSPSLPSLLDFIDDFSWWPPELYSVRTLSCSPINDITASKANVRLLAWGEKDYLCISGLCRTSTLCCRWVRCTYSIQVEVGYLGD